MRKIISNFNKLYCYLIGSLLGRILYSKEYFPKGKWFDNWKSPGWKWIIPDFWCRVLNKRHRGVKWPVSPYTNIGGSNIIFNPDDLNVFQAQNTYFQAFDGSHIYIGHGTYIAQGVGIITSNHDVYNLDSRSNISDIKIGNDCWIGMNSVILPGVVLGNRTIVGAGSIVTHSFPEGYCVIAGNPAKKIKDIEKEKCTNSHD